MEQQGPVGLLRVHAIHRDDVEMNVQIQRRPESLHDGQASRPQPTTKLALPCTSAEVRVDGADERAKHHARGVWGIGHFEAQGIRQRKHILTGRHVGKQVVHAGGRPVGHAATEAAWAESTSFARKANNPAVPTILATDAKKSVHEDPAMRR